MKLRVLREFDRMEMLLDQIKAVEAERDAMLAKERQSARQVRKSAIAIDATGNGLALAATPTRFVAQSMVRRARCPEWRSLQEGDDHGVGPQAGRGFVEVCQRRRGDRGSCRQAMTTLMNRSSARA
jgi:hypothetical protein